MEMLSFWNFQDAEDGAVTVDWVVLTALGLSFLALVFNDMSDGTTGLANDTKTHLSEKF